MELLIIVVIVVAVIGYAVTAYNSLVKNRTLVGEGWSGIDVQLKRRSNLIPNLLETVKGYMNHERETLEKVTAMRSQVESAQSQGAAGRAQAENMLSGALRHLFAVAENYPDLKADANFRELHDSLSEIEDDIQKARRYYNGSVRDLNILVESFPSNLIANHFKFEKAAFFEIDDEEDRAVPIISFD